MNGSEIALIITALGTFMTSLGSVLMTLRNGRKIETVHALTKQVQTETNGMKAELVKEVREASFAKGVKSETDKSSADHAER